MMAMLNSIPCFFMKKNTHCKFFFVFKYTLKNAYSERLRTRFVFRNPTEAANKFDLSILRRPQFDSVFSQIGYPIHTYAVRDWEKFSPINIRVPVSMYGRIADNKLPPMFVLNPGISVESKSLFFQKL